LVLGVDHLGFKVLGSYFVEEHLLVAQEPIPKDHHERWGVLQLGESSF
jgi:hypothetical protein